MRCRKESRNDRKGRKDRKRKKIRFLSFLIFLSFLPAFGDVAARDVVVFFGAGALHKRTFS